ncbi:transcriptional regulator, TetR family [Lentzea xinjiangensis]|uniref:Transcriptional regulator, TetR family n=2 Tax=Lentzea xinjiangensis TaxID=402600 RepID=A0A1H9IWM9_9PSEU|nr:transcriptional regulator, TetR family [Lentzea xinjiangensis]
MKAAPSTDKGRATLARILDVACELFYSRGVRATSIDQIAQASKTGKGQFYHFFSGKSDLVQSVVERQTELVLAAQRPWLDDIATGEDLRRWADRLVRLHEEDDDPVRCPLGALAAEISENDPDVKTSIEAAFVRWRTLIAAGIQRMVDSGEIGADTEPDSAAEALLAAYQGGVLLSQVHGSTSTLRLCLGREVEQILR